MDFEDLITVDNKMLESAFNIKISEKDIKNTTTNYMNEISSSITADITPASNDFESNLKTLSQGVISNYTSSPKEKIINPLTNEIIPIIYMNDIDNIVSDYFKTESAQQLLSGLEKKYIIPSNVYESTYSSLISGMLKGYTSVYNTKDKTYTKDENNMGAILMNSMSDNIIEEFMKQTLVIATKNTMAQKMTEAVMQKEILTKVGELTGKLMGSMSNAFDVDPNKIAGAFKFDLSEEELSRIMNAMINTNNGGSAKTNLISLGYQDKDEPTSIAIYFKSFDGKENFIDFIDKYNEQMKKTKL